MPWSSNALLCLLAIANQISLTTAAQQQHQSRDASHHRSPQESAPASPSGQVLGATKRHRKDTVPQQPTTESALATLAPAASLPAVRAHLSGPSDATGVSRLPARSLQDWQVEDIILLATVEGKLYARERASGAPKWELEVDRPMIETIYHINDTDNPDMQHDLLWIVEPSQDGALYVYSPDGALGMKRLGLTVKQLVEELSPYAGDEPAVVYTAEKKNTLYTIDSSNGNVLKMFSSSGAVTNTDRTCRRLNALESLDDKECEPIGTLTLGRVEYTVAIQDKATGNPLCTLSYFEWAPNVRDKDLLAQYQTTLDSKYLYSKHDSSVVALEHALDHPSVRRTAGGQTLLYRHKLDSPVARVYDVVKPFDHMGTDTGPTSLVILPQPVKPVDEWPTVDSIFVNCTESGSWYALSEHNYPLVTDGATRAMCYLEDSTQPVSMTGQTLSKQRARLTGVHPLSTLSSNVPQIPTISGPDTRLLGDGGSVLADKQMLLDPPSYWSSMRPSPWTIGFMGLTTLLLLLYPVGKKLRTTDKVKLEAPVKTIDTDPKESVEISRADSSQPEQKLKIRVPEPAEETVFLHEQHPMDSPTTEAATVDGATSPEDTVRKLSLPEGSADDVSPPELDTPKPEKEKKARRGVRGGRKVKEKQELAEQRRRANSQTPKKPGSPLEMIKVDATPNEPQVSEPVAQVISVDASESPSVSGKLRINNLVVDTDEVIGHGSAGTCVFTGSFEGNEVAVKRMLSQYYELASQEVAFLQQRDDHPNVIKYYCQQKDQHFLYIALELCQTSLMDLYFPQNVDMDRRELLSTLLSAIQREMPKVLHQLAAGLHHLHSRRIIHRDIKPQNILIAKPKKWEVNKGPRLVISDFGLCKSLPENVSTLVDPTGNAGTCGWKAPELISQPKDSASNNGHSSVSQSSSSEVNGIAGGLKRAADIFSLGCLFFWCLTGGCHPFDDKEGWAQIRELNIKKNNLQNMHKLDLGSDTEEPMQLIRAMLEHRPEDRPTSMDVIKHPFFWDATTRLAFLCDVSDHFEREPRTPPSAQLELLESFGPMVITKGDFLRQLPASFIDTLGKQRKYTGSRMLDLMRALRNKRNHYEDMPEEVKRRVGPLPGGYLQFWTARFPKLLMACYWVVKDCKLEETDRFRGYFQVASE